MGSYLLRDTETFPRALLPRHGQTRPGWRTGQKSATANGPLRD